MQYAECLKKYYNAVDGIFYDVISFGEKSMPQFDQFLKLRELCQR